MPMMYIKSLIWSGFEIKDWIEDQFQSSPKLVGIWTVLRCIFVPNLEIVTSIGGELWHTQTQNGGNFDFGVQFDLEGQGQSPPKTIGILTKVFYTYCPNLVILAWTGDELQGCQPWEIDFLTIYQKLPKFSLLNGIFSLLKHEMVTDYFKQFPYFAEN